MEYKIREMYASEYPLLADFLYTAIFQRDENNLLPRSVIEEPALNVYIKDFGQQHDYCLCAETDSKVVGAVWVRMIDGYGHVDADTPEIAISLYKEYRGYGIGTVMMESMLRLLKNKGYKKTSLAVQKDNCAFHMYQKIGFKILEENQEEYIMEYYFN